MKNTQISSKHIAAVILLFLLGNVFIRVGYEVGSKKIYIIIAGAAIACFSFFMVSRLIKIYPGAGFPQMMEGIFGKTISKICLSAYGVYFVFTASLVILSAVFYLHIVELTDTPKIIIALCLCIWCTYSLFAGLPALGRFCLMSLGIVMLVLLSTLILNFFNGNFSFLLPVPKFDLTAIQVPAYIEYALDFGDIIAVLFLASHFKITKKPRTPLYTALGSYVCILLLTQLRNISVLGDKLSRNLLYPSTTAVSLINVEDVLQRIESFVAFTFCLCTFVRISVYLLAVLVTVNHISGRQNKTLVPLIMGTVIFILSVTVFSTPAQVIDWFRTKYVLYSIPFQLIIPVVLWGVAEYKNKALQNKFTEADNRS